MPTNEESDQISPFYNTDLAAYAAQYWRKSVESDPSDPRNMLISRIMEFAERTNQYINITEFLNILQDKIRSHILKSLDLLPERVFPVIVHIPVLLDEYMISPTQISGMLDHQIMKIHSNGKCEYVKFIHSSKSNVEDSGEVPPDYGFDEKSLKELCERIHQFGLICFWLS